MNGTPFPEPDVVMGRNWQPDVGGDEPIKADGPISSVSISASISSLSFGMP